MYPIFISLAVALAAMTAPTIRAQTVRTVGPTGDFALPSEAEAASEPGDRIEIDADGDYAGDTVRWRKSDLVIVGVNGRPRIHGESPLPESQGGIWVFLGDDITIENIDFSGAVSAGRETRSASGVWFSGFGLTVRQCSFHDNENGIITRNETQTPSAEPPTRVVTIEYSEFFRNGSEPSEEERGGAHNVYCGCVGTLVFQFNHTYDAIWGHNLKSRAATNILRYNLITESGDTVVSRSIDLPQGGTAYVIGNVIQQAEVPGQNTEMVTFAAECNTEQQRARLHATMDLYVVNNTFINEREEGQGYLVSSKPAVSPNILLLNNFLVGRGRVLWIGEDLSATVDPSNVWCPDGEDPGFVDPANHDYQLRPGTIVAGLGVDPGEAPDGFSLLPDMHYVHPMSSAPRPIDGEPEAGAYELE